MVWQKLGQSCKFVLTSASVEKCPIFTIKQTGFNFTLDTKEQTVLGYNDGSANIKCACAFEETSENSQVRYCCDQCEYRATRLMHLKTHQKIVRSSKKFRK